MVIKIKKISAREILDSRAWPTIEVTVFLNNGLSASASAPSNSYLGEDMFQEKRDADSKRYFGQGVLGAIRNVEEKISPAIIGLSPYKQKEIDKKLNELDGTADKSSLGVNAITATSLAVARAAALAKKKSLHVYLNEAFFGKEDMKLPVPIFTMFNGSYCGDTNLDFQEYLLIPNAKSALFKNKKTAYSQMLRTATESYHNLGLILRSADYDTDTGSEGGYAPEMDSSLQALELMMASVIASGYESGKDLSLGINIGSASLYNSNSKEYVFSLDNNHFSADNMMGIYNQWLKDFPISYLEDPFAEDDLNAWQEASISLGDKMVLAGSSLFSSNANKLRAMLKNSSSNAIVITPGEAGTLTETVECLSLARRHNYKIIISQRGAETNDDFISDLAVASAADYFKGGAPARGERVAKWNRLLFLENSLYGNSN